MKARDSLAGMTTFSPCEASCSLSAKERCLASSWNCAVTLKGCVIEDALDIDVAPCIAWMYHTAAISIYAVPRSRHDILTCCAYHITALKSWRVTLCLEGDLSSSMDI